MNLTRLPSGLLVPGPSDNELRQLQDEQIRRDYYAKHQLCPECFSEPNCVTTVGMMTCKNMHDNNTTWCGCGWSGEVHDLVAPAQSVPASELNHVKSNE